MGRRFYDLFISENVWILLSAPFSRFQVMRCLRLLPGTVGCNPESPGVHSMGDTEDLAMLGSRSAECGYLLSALFPLGLWGYWSEGRADSPSMALVPGTKLALLVKSGASLPPCMCAVREERRADRPQTSVNMGEAHRVHASTTATDEEG